MIRLATEQDIPRVLELLKQFHQDSPYADIAFDDTKATDTVRMVLNPKTGVCIVSEQNNVITGVIGGFISDLPFSRTRITMEIVWWVDPKFRAGTEGIALMEAYEYWARNVAKAEYIQLTNLENRYKEVLNRVYTRKGYDKKEETWLYQL